MRLVDLSAPIVASPPETPEALRTEIRFSGHAEGAAAIEALLGVPARLLRDGEGWAVEEFGRLGTHNVTHVDAPWHYNARLPDGSRSPTIDELALERFFGPGLVVDATDREDGDALSAADVRDRLPREPVSGDIVLVRTGRDAFLTAADYMIRGPGVTAEATHWLHERGVRVMGVDAWGWDAPLHLQAAEANERDAGAVFWAAHQAGLDYCQLERLANLGALPAAGFDVACFPLKIVGASAAPARVVAFLHD